ncbi:MAG: HNH endonuclease family protein [Dehalogenimonas sp.]
MEENFPDELLGKILPFFADWLIENVHLVEITAYSDADAYTIFETMNDRGLSLTPTEMLKGYLLANINDVDRRNEASKLWRTRVTALQQIGKEEDADAIKSWLRSQFAQSIRERKRGALPKDFDLIGTEFHRWVRDHEKQLGLKDSAAFWKFIQEDFSFYSYWYERIRRAAESPKPGLEAIYYNAQNNFTLQYPALLAPLNRTEPEEVILRKLRIVASYIDIVIARRTWNWKDTSYSTMQYNIFQLVIMPTRGKPVADLAKILKDRLDAETETFASNDRFYLHGMNGRQIHRLLARMTDYLETQSVRPSHYMEYAKRGGKHGYEVEHIWANHPEWHKDEFEHANDFREYRNRIGDLLLLPKSFNASYGDLPYSEKREHYLKQNLLAASLHERSYEHDNGNLSSTNTFPFIRVPLWQPKPRWLSTSPLGSRHRTWSP